MKKLNIKLCTALLAIFALAGASVSAQPAAEPAPVPPPGAPAALSTAELEKLVEPIALHPDPLIAVILPASVYPLEIVQAARFVKDTNNIAKVDQQDWDENIKAVAKFPTLIAKMDADLEWTTKLGQAFLDQPKELMDAIQSLRAKAQQAGTLRNSDQQVVVVTNSVVEKTVDQQVVVVTNTVVQIQPSNPEVVYVPSYPPTVYYPPPAYVYDPYAPLITFGVGMAMGAIIANNCDWHGGCVNHYNGGNVNINNNNNININNNNARVDARSSTRNNTSQKWQPDQNRMRNSGSSATREARGWTGSGAGGARASTQQAGANRGGLSQTGSSTGRGNTSARPSTGNTSARPSTGNNAARPSTGNSSARPSAANTSARSSSGAAANRSAPSSSSRDSAFSGSSSGRSAQNYSSRGSSSRSSGYSGGSSRGGGGFGGGGGSRGGGGRGGGRR